MRGKKSLLFILIIALVLVAGCTQTGMIINKSEEDDYVPEKGRAGIKIGLTEETGTEKETPTEVQPEALPETEPQIPKPPEPTEPLEPASPTPQPDPCEGITCPDSVRTCPDGFKARCRNACTGGACSVCMPDCSGHGIEPTVPEPEGEAGDETGECELSCGVCEEPNNESCVCDLIVPCDGNNICEQGEYQESGDCPSCDDENSCTVDLYNYTSGKCYYEITVPCCGNGACEVETENPGNCPADCQAPEEPEPEESGEPAEESSVLITNVEPDEERVKIENPGSVAVDMTDWTINDTLSTPRTVFIFPDFVLQPGAHVLILKGQGEDDAMHLYRNKDNNVWNNDGDTAVLIDSQGQIISTYSYGD